MYSSCSGTPPSPPSIAIAIKTCVVGVSLNLRKMCTLNYYLVSSLRFSQMFHKSIFISLLFFMEINY